MIKHSLTPFIAHVFICTNDRKGARKSCADGASSLIKDTLKQAAATRGWKGKVRISTSGCLGVCENGPNVMIYPQGLWFSEVSLADIDNLIDALAEIIENAS